MGPKGSVQERIAVSFLCFGYAGLTSLFAVMAGMRSHEYDNAAVVQALFIEVTLGFAAIILLQRRGWTVQDFGFRMSAPITIAAMGLAFVVLVACTLAYYALSWSGALLGWTAVTVKFTATPVLMLLFLAVNSVFEEFFVTGYLIEATRESGLAFAVSVSTAVRLLYHTYQGPVAFASIVPIGLIFGAVYARHRNLWPVIAAHTVINVYSWSVS